MTEPTKDAPPAENPAAQTASEIMAKADTLGAPMLKAKLESVRPRQRVGVMIATPLKHFDGTAADLDRQVPQIGRTLRELAARGAEHKYEFEFAASCGGLCSAQNRMAHVFLKSDAQYLLRWDSDLHDQAGREADAILRLLSQGQPVIAGLYCKREPGARRPTWVANWLTEAKVQAGGLLQVAELGGGFKLYHRKALTEIRRIFGEIPLQDEKGGAKSIMYRERETGENVCGFFQIRTVDGDLVSEDFWLDYLFRCARVPIIADTVVRLRQVERVGAALVSYPAADQPWPPIPAEDAQ